MKQILFFGGTGNTGAAAINTLLASPQFAAQEIAVKALVRDATSDKAKALQAKGVQLCEGSYDNPGSLQMALKDAQACFLCCSNCLDQVELETNVIEAAEASATCQYLVKVSTAQAIIPNQDKIPPYIAPDSIIQYGTYHAAIEDRLAQCKNLKYTVLRPNYFMQNGVGDIFVTIPQNKMIAYPQVNNHKANMVDARDVGTVAAKLLLLEDTDNYNGKLLNVCGPKAWSLQEIADLYSKSLDHIITVVRCSPEEFAQGLVTGAGFPEWLAKSVTKTHSVFWDNNGCSYESSPEVKELLGDHAPRTLEQWVQEMAPMVKFA